MNHSPLPWSVNRKVARFVDAGANGDGLTSVCDCDPLGEMPASQAQANAAFIVHAVNNHDKLRGALLLAQSIIGIEGASGTGCGDSKYTEARKTISAALKESEAR